MSDYSTHYLQIALQTLQTAMTDSHAAIQEAAQAVATAIQKDRLLYLFGSGHSALVAREVVGRAGGLVPAVLIEDVLDGDAERVAGMARIIAGRYAMSAGDVLVVISHSGINPVPVEMAILGKQAGLVVVAITSLAHSQSVASRHAQGRKLYEVADVVVDTHVPRGDTALHVRPDVATGALSGVVGCAIVQAITVQAVSLLAENANIPPTFISANMPEGRAHNDALLQRYQTRLARYQLPRTWDHD